MLRIILLWVHHQVEGLGAHNLESVLDSFGVDSKVGSLTLEVAPEVVSQALVQLVAGVKVELRSQVGGEGFLEVDRRQSLFLEDLESQGVLALDV